MAPRISGYLTTYNCIDAGQPFLAAIHSLLGLCSEVVVADGGSTDGTWEQLQALAARRRKLDVGRFPVHASRAPWALSSDLRLKARAREACVGDYCWHGEPTEIVVPTDWCKVDRSLERLSQRSPLLAIPVLEYWRGLRHVRRDEYPAAPKLSLNLPHISHGLPLGFREPDEYGVPHALPGAQLASSYVDLNTGEPVVCESLIPHSVESLRQNSRTIDAYEQAFFECLDDLPVVHDMTWVSIERQLHRLRSHWAEPRWMALGRSDPIPAWPLFDKPWQRVTDSEIAARAHELEDQGPGVLSGETELSGLMECRTWLPATTRREVCPAKPATTTVHCVGFGPRDLLSLEAPALA